MKTFHAKHKLILSFLLVCLLACTKYNNPAPFFEDLEKPAGVQVAARKLLMISIDGAVGE